MTFSSEGSFDIGFLGGGQLARMSIQAAQRMGLRALSLDSGNVTPASQIAPALVGSFDDIVAIATLASRCEFLTLENEFIPADALAAGLKKAGRRESCLVPGLDALATIQDKLRQREAYQQHRVPSPLAVAIPSHHDPIGYPRVLKARFGGYDGKGTRYAQNASEFEALRTEWEGAPWLAEEFVEFKRELAVMVYLGEGGEGAFPTMESVQVGHVCDLVYPSEADASDVALKAARAMGGTGLFGVELFQTRSGQILVNEIAPRPHNSGHYTLDWGGVSQFEQHVRMVMGLPPLPPAGGPVCMANLLGQAGAGDWRKGMRAALEDPDVRFHWYGKAESRPGRKMGHLNVPGKNAEMRAKAARERFYRAWCS